jgi:hypothetical protein
MSSHAATALIREILRAPPPPDLSVGNLLEAALAHHNAGRYKAALRVGYQTVCGGDGVCVCVSSV